jgi:cytochrome c biogenesis protein CcmG/thiol:disulfide interchange protein DsbE
VPQRIGPWLITAVVAAAALFALLSAPGAPPPLGRGSEAPDFTLSPLGGGPPVSLSALRSKVVLVNFWASWCKPCEDEMPAMERLYAELGGDDFELLAVSVDDAEADVSAFRERLALSFPILWDPEKSVAEAYQTYRFPESFLVGRDGVLIERYIGPKDWDAPAYVERIRRLLEAG